MSDLTFSIGTGFPARMAINHLHGNNRTGPLISKQFYTATMASDHLPLINLTCALIAWFNLILTHTKYYV